MAFLGKFASLGRALAGGADTMLARVISAGRAINEVKRIATRVFVSPVESAVSRLIGLASRESAAGSQLTNMMQQGIPGSADYPINPFLFGDEPGGLRSKVGITIPGDEGKRSIFWTAESEDIFTWEQVRELLEERRDKMRAEKRYEELEELYDLWDFSKAIFVYGVRRF